MDLPQFYDKEDDGHIGMEDFELFLESPDVCDTLCRFGVDCEGPRQLGDFLFQPPEPADGEEVVENFRCEIAFADFLLQGPTACRRTGSTGETMMRAASVATWTWHSRACGVHILFMYLTRYLPALAFWVGNLPIASSSAAHPPRSPVTPHDTSASAYFGLVG